MFSVLLGLELLFVLTTVRFGNPLVSQSKKMFWFYSRRLFNNEASTEMFILLMIDSSFASVSLLIEFKM